MLTSNNTDLYQKSQQSKFFCEKTEITAISEKLVFHQHTFAGTELLHSVCTTKARNSGVRSTAHLPYKFMNVTPNDLFFFDQPRYKFILL